MKNQLHPSTPHHASKRFGQNFLSDQRIIQRIVAEVEPRSDETIVEIGPGRGALTLPLLERTGALVAIEFDENLIPILTDKFKAKANFRLIQSDALTVDFCEAIRPATQARIVANLPYNVATAIVQRLIEQRNCLTEFVVMLQREVVERIIAVPGTPERGYLSVLVQAHCETEKLFDVAPGSFRPAPKVWSSVIRLTPRPKPAVEVSSEKLLWQVVSAGFAQRRKTMLNNLRNAPSPLQEIIKAHGGASIVLCRAEVDLQRRAETLTLDEWARIACALE
ncbi:MAG TPA: 16S rRNA (adenine(1518)-N(6)/adenine(1519)-N(6))-dimethyltransferase RsmA [Pyrinomonadaceae bacterium]|jgi:16S rRNA (adenine1518-N6/adenine1519-N6)-dimethyltransferase|nr:16S rRNA (adenine(1518)-N(6)/adenine(1519)-N(6))-dimethyltransferase RsmA [Pyrinomonadaceae bacterium]